MIDYQNANDVFDVYGTYPQEDGSMQELPLGRFLIENGKLRILEDHHNGFLGKLLHSGPVGPNVRVLNSLSSGGYTRVVAESHVQEGQHIDKIPKGTSQEGMQVQNPPNYIAPGLGEAITEEAPSQFEIQAPPAIFDYMDATMRQPQMIEVKENKVYMNGTELPKSVVDRILYKVQNGLATLRYRKGV